MPKTSTQKHIEMMCFILCFLHINYSKWIFVITRMNIHSQGENKDIERRIYIHKHILHHVPFSILYIPLLLSFVYSIYLFFIYNLVCDIWLPFYRFIRVFGSCLYSFLSWIFVIFDFCCYFFSFWSHVRLNLFRSITLRYFSKKIGEKLLDSSNELCSISWKIYISKQFKGLRIME